jgi:hypothetical protein
MHMRTTLTLMNLARPAGLTQDTLAAAILSALNDADAAARSGTWTAEQSEREKRYWMAQSVPDLISETSRWYRQC